MPKIDIDKEIERYRLKLLDFSLSNRMLNYKKSKSRTIQLYKKTPNYIFERLTVQGKPFKLVSINKISGDLLSAAEENEIDELSVELPSNSTGKEAAIYQDSNLYIGFNEEKTERLIKAIRTESHSVVQETGVNFLHLAGCGKSHSGS